MTYLVRILFAACFGIGVFLSLAALASTLSPWLGLGFFVVAVIISGFEYGDKTRPQMLFLTIGTALAMVIPQFALTPWWWAGVAICALLVLTMKLDGGDSHGG